MTIVFADSYYYLAMVNEKDAGHAKAFEFGNSYRGRIVTTEWVLAEVGDALVQPQWRSAFVEVLHSAQNDSRTTIVDAKHDQFIRGADLFAARSDKEWSLTYCISFVVMDEQNIREALTGDHHFQQSGFVALLT